MSDENNPLLSTDFRIPFHRIRAEHVVPGVRALLERAREELDGLTGREAPPTYADTVERLDRLVASLRRGLKPVSHLLSVAESPELREAYNEVLPEITRFWTRLTLNEALWERLKRFAETDEAAHLQGIHARHLEKLLREFRRAGADLDPAGKERLEEIRVELSRLEQKFSENVLDATNAYSLHVTDEDRLDGIPEAPRRRFRKRAEEKGVEGWLLTLDYPSFEAVVKHAKDRALRREIYLAYMGRCREGEHGNAPVIRRILALRKEMAELLGYPDFPDYQLEEMMSGGGEGARAFVAEINGLTRPYWERDVEQLRSHAAELGLDRLRPWDVSFVSEALRRARYEVDDELLRPYFALETVLEGLFTVAERVFGLGVEEREIEEVWHPDVRYFDVVDEEGRRIGSFYADFFPREEKRQGAWMNDFLTGGPEGDGSLGPHLGVICGNFTPPGDDRPALLTHREVQTTFHEFGHLLHHLTTRVPVAGRAGLNVAWDFVELPSQLMENWTWEREALDLFARHHETGEPLPEELFRRMLAARRFMGGWSQMRQLSFATTDLRLHTEFEPGEAGSDEGAAREEGAASDAEGAAGDGGGETGEDPASGAEGADVLAFVEAVVRAFVPDPEFARHHNTTAFTHLFSGGYASLYYSYLWSEVLDADVFTRFRDEGIFSRDVGREYVEAILSRGDSADPDVLFREFMGRDPDPSALVARNLGELRAEPLAAS